MPRKRAEPSRAEPSKPDDGDNDGDNDGEEAEDGGRETEGAARLASVDPPSGEGAPPPNPFATEKSKAGYTKRKSIVDQLKSAVGAGAPQKDEPAPAAVCNQEPAPAPYKKMNLHQIGKAIVTGEVEHGSAGIEATESPWRPKNPSPGSIPRKLKNEDAKWADPTFDPTGKEEDQLRDFRRPEDWWLSAEQAVEVLEMERRGLKKDFADAKKPASVLNSIMATNRMVTQGLKKMVESARIFE
jgi:hypothetical protein